MLSDRCDLAAGQSNSADILRFFDSKATDQMFGTLIESGYQTTPNWFLYLAERSPGA